MTDQTDDPTAEETAEHQPALPTLELPDYHGRKPAGMKTGVNGAGNRISKAHELGERVVLVVEAKVKRAGHEETDDGLIYSETLKVSDLFELDHEPGRRLLRFLRSTYRVAADSAAGREPLPDLGETGYTDENGVVLTDREVAERRGDPVAFLTGVSWSSEFRAVIVFADGDRLLWPDEFPAGSECPEVADETEDGLVAEVLNADTGEALTPETTPEQPADTDDGGWDDVPDYGSKADGPAETEEPTVGELEREQLLPDSAAFEMVDCSIPELRERIAGVADLVLVRRYLEAEKQGRGRGLKARTGALDAIHNRIAELETPPEPQRGEIPEL